MSLDLNKYRNLFIEEATEHLSEMSSALLELEKDSSSSDAIDQIFRMAHGIKGMAASLEYGSITEVSHCLEDRMSLIRDGGELGAGEEVALLFRGLETLEAMIAIVRETGESPPPSFPAAVAFLEASRALASADPAQSAKKKSPDSLNAEVSGAPAPEHHEASASLAPPPSLRVNTETLDRFLGTVGEVILSSSQLRTASTVDGTPSTPGVSVGLDRMDRAVGELQRRALEMRTTPLQRIVGPLPRMAREIARRAGKRIDVVLRNTEIELDRTILDRLSDPLIHIFRNAVDHGIEAPDLRLAAGKSETGTIAVDARRQKDLIRIAISDDGAGLDLEELRSRAVQAGVVVADLAEDLPPDEVASLIFHPGLSTAAVVSDVSGRGVGMDAVRATIEGLGGHVEVRTERGLGTTMTLVVPITAAVQRVLLLGIGSEIVAIPIAKVERIVEIPVEEIERSGHEAFVLVDDDPLPVIDLLERLALPASESAPTAVLVLADIRGEVMALHAHAIAGQQQIYVKPLPELLSSRKVLAGLTLLGEGRPVFLLDLNQL
jgi:two-component system chemotaxis sensor kinase CheA